MNVNDLLLRSFEDVHRELRGNLAELPEGSLWWQPARGMNHIGFLLWHLVRDEDTMFANMTGRRQVWWEGGWAERVGLGRLGDVATLEPGDADGLRFELADFLEYAEAVWSRTLELVPEFTEARLDDAVWPGWNVARSLVEGSIGHSWMHLGEIRYLMGLRGWRHTE